MQTKEEQFDYIMQKDKSFEEYYIKNFKCRKD